MRARPLGVTGLTVTPMGLGLAALGRPYYINLGRDRDFGAGREVADLERRCHAVLDAAYDLGIRYVDAARSYGLAESFLASWMTDRPDASAMTVGSKWGYTYTGEWRRDAAAQEVKDHSYEALRRQIAESRALLGDLLHLYQIHSATIESGVLENRRVLAELVALRAGGLRIGLTTSGPRQAAVIRRAMEVDVDGVNPFQCVQATWNLLDPSAGDALNDAHARGWGVIVKEALANGRLTSRNRGPEIQPVRDTADSLGTSVDAMSIAAALANPWADVVLSGAATKDQLESNAAAIDVTVPLDVSQRLASMAEASDDYWNRRKALPWA